MSDKTQKKSEYLKKDIKVEKYLEECFTINKNNTRSYFVPFLKGIKL